MTNPKSHLFQINNIIEDADYGRQYKAEEIHFSRVGIRGSLGCSKMGLKIGEGEGESSGEEGVSEETLGTMEALRGYRYEPSQLLTESRLVLK